MKKIISVVVAGFTFCTACVAGAGSPARTTSEAMLNFLPYLNQKVAGYLDANHVDTLDAQTYKAIVDRKCGSLPSCRENAAIMFSTYSVHPRQINGIFSVLLCDKERRVKIMEDFSCNEHKVEIPTFQTNAHAPCIAEDRWKDKVVEDCPDL